MQDDGLGHTQDEDSLVTADHGCTQQKSADEEDERVLWEGRQGSDDTAHPQSREEAGLSA